MELDRIKMQVREGLDRLLPRLSQYKYALIVLLVGILLLYAGGGARDRPELSQPSGTEEAGFDLDSFEQELTDCLLYTSDAADWTGGAHAVARADRGVGLRFQYPGVGKRKREWFV